MAFFNSAIEVLQTLVVALGAGLGVWGAINLMEGYGNDNPGAKSQGMKQHDSLRVAYGYGTVHFIGPFIHIHYIYSVVEGNKSTD